MSLSNISTLKAHYYKNYDTWLFISFLFLIHQSNFLVNRIWQISLFYSVDLADLTYSLERLFFFSSYPLGSVFHFFLALVPVLRALQLLERCSCACPPPSWICQANPISSETLSPLSTDEQCSVVPWFLVFVFCIFLMLPIYLGL